MKIYVASSWRNDRQPSIVTQLRIDGHEVYDFRNPDGGSDDSGGFQWSEIDPEWQSWTPDEYFKALDSMVAGYGYRLDMDAMRWADACVLVMPCGRSAHLEMGWFAGKGKITCILHDSKNPIEPELMVKMCDKQFSDLDEMRLWLSTATRVSDEHRCSSEATEQLRKHVNYAGYTTNHRENALEVCDEADMYSDIFGELLKLLDRIDVEDDPSLAVKRFDIIEDYKQYGLTVVFGEKTSGRIN